MGKVMTKTCNSSNPLSGLSKILILLTATDKSLATQALGQFFSHEEDETYQLPEGSIILGIRTFLLISLLIVVLVSG